MSVNEQSADATKQRLNKYSPYQYIVVLIVILYYHFKEKLLLTG